MTELAISLDQIEATSSLALEIHGAQPHVAGIMAKNIRRAEETGNRVCGLSYLQSYCQQLQSGRVSGKANHRLDQRTAVCLAIDAQGGFPQVAFNDTSAHAAKMVAEFGLGLYIIANSHTCTALGYFTEHFATQHGLAAIGFTNASACVAPPGAGQPVIGTNPIAMTVPGPGGVVRFHMDQATTATALGTVKDAAAAGQSVPLGWVVDQDGRPSTDPTVVGAGGTMASAGGAKGWGFGLMAELMAAGLGGGTLSKDLAPLKAAQGPQHGLSHTFLIMDTDQISLGAFASQFEALSQAIYTQDNARLPGNPRRCFDPVEVPVSLWTECQALAQKD